MPRNRADYIRRRMRQADAGIVKAMNYLAEIYVTLAATGHRREAGEAWFYLLTLDQIRQAHLHWYRKVWAGTERELWTSDDLRSIIESADVIPDPKYD